MQFRFQNLFYLSAIISFLFLCICGELPADPATELDNVTANITVPDGSSGIIQGKPVTIQIIVRYPNLTKMVQLLINNVSDTTFYCNAGTTFDTLLAIRTFNDTGKIVIKADIELTNGTFKPFYDTITVLPKYLTVAFDTVPQAHYVATGDHDTLVFAASTDPAGGSIVYTAAIIPAIATDTVKTVAQGNKTFVIFTPSQKGVYTLSCIAQSGTARDTASILLTAYNRPVFVDASKTNVITSGTTDTLIFTAQADSGDTVTLRLLNAAALDSGSVKVLVSGLDSLVIIFTPEEAKKYTFLILSTDKYGTDTISVQKTVVAETVSVWKQAAVALTAVEGTAIEHSLAAYLNDTTIKADSLTVTRGTIVNKVWKYTVPFGSAPNDSVIVKATKNGAVSECRITLTVTPGDTTKPVITRKTPATDTFTTSASTLACSFVITDKGAGVGAVTFRIGSTVLTDTTHSDSVWQCVIKNLVANQAATVTVIATDASMAKNADSLSVYLTYDSTIADNVAPIITVTSTYQPGMRVTAPTGTIMLTAVDVNGIDSVYYTVNSTAEKINALSSGNVYSISYTLNRYGLDTITIYAVDGSSAHNAVTATILLDYNLLLSGDIDPLSPVNNATETDTLPVFKWTGISDADGDSVYYRVLYSTVSDFTVGTATKSGEVKDSIVTIAGSKTLSSNTKYYWRVIGYTKSKADTVQSDMMSFTTLNKAPVVTLVSPVKGAVKIDPSSGILKFSAADPESGTLTCSVAAGTVKSSLWSGTLQKDGLAAGVCTLSTLGTLSRATKYYWQVTATDNGNPAKSDTSAVDSFYTVNSAPVWAAIASKDTSYYKGSIDLSTFCSDPEGQSVTYTVTAGASASVTGSSLSFVADSAEITIKAIDNFTAQPCTSSVTFRRWFVNPLMKLIPSGGASFQMGTTDTFTIRRWTDSEGSGSTIWSDGQPIHTVSFTNNIVMDSTEVTQSDYELLLSANPSNCTIGTTVAIHNTTWFDAVLYCNARSKRDGFDTVYSYISVTGTPGNGCSDLGGIQIDYSKNGYRLPTEAEWEFACRAGTATDNYWSDNDSVSKYAWMYSFEDDATTVEHSDIHNVAQLGANSYQLYDMIGNVAEWCNDWYGTYSSDLQIDPTGPSSGTKRISRGCFGVWYYSDTESSDVIRTGANSAFRYSNGPYGFRCVRTRF